MVARCCRMLSANGDVAARCRSLKVCSGSGEVLSRGMANVHGKLRNNSKTSSSSSVDDSLHMCMWWSGDRVVLLVASVGRDVASTKRTCGCVCGDTMARRTCGCRCGDMVARRCCGLKESTWRRRLRGLVCIFVAAVSLLNIGSSIRPGNGF